MNRYLVFSYEDYYPGGGWTDFIGSAKSIDEAKKIAQSKNYRSNCYEIIDLEIEEVILEAYFDWSSNTKEFFWKNVIPERKQT